MPASEKSTRALATTSSSRNRPIVAKTGVIGPELTVGLAVWATMQIEQAASVVCVGWLWADSSAAIQIIKDRQNHAGALDHVRIVT